MKRNTGILIAFTAIVEATAALIVFSDHRGFVPAYSYLSVPKLVKAHTGIGK